MLNELKWLGHASFRLDLSQTIYIDPWKLNDQSPKPADLILISHGHYDHFSAEDVALIRSDETRILASADVAEQLDGDVSAMKPGDTIEHQGISITAVAAYNVEKDFHPRENDWLGFIIKSETGSLYYAGDTDMIPEFDDVAAHDIDVALLPVGGTYTMDPAEAVRAAELIKPNFAVPYHYGDIVGTGEDARLFTSNYSGESALLELEQH